MSSSIFVRVFSVVLLIVSFSHSVHAKEYSIPELQIEVQINNDGTITITEHRTYVFDGSYSWANYRLPKSGYSAMRNIQVSEGDHSLINLNTEEPETFLVEESDKAFNIKWFFDAEDEERTFTITYTLENALVFGPDWSELFWTYAASGREKSTDDFEILIRLPEMVPDSSLKSWVREPAWDISSNLLENGFQFTGENISRKQVVIIRAIFPTSVFDENMVQVTDPDFSMALAEQQETNFREEQRLAAEDEQRRLALAIEISIIVAGISIIVFIFFYRKYGSRHKIALSVNESIMLPGREKPATIGWLLMNRTVSHNLIMATLLDLARRGYFTIKENEPEEEGWMSSDDPYFSVHPEEKSPERNLTDYELNLLNFVNERISEEGNKMEEIFAFGKSDVTKWFYAWKEKLTDHCKDQKWIDPESYTGAYWNAGIQSILLLASVSAIFLLHPLMFLAMAISFVGLILSFVIIRRTPKGEELYRRWSSYRKALQN
ncbi:MAG TPA: hypothetical protein DD671_13280, partial [Balneolaceae bacterium]|nr:hypothetical protein [Balneolaceae bacterium]